MKFLLLFTTLLYSIFTVQESIALTSGTSQTAYQELHLTAEESAWIKSHKSVNVAVRPGWMPIEFRLESEANRGVSLDYLDEISKLTGLHFTYVQYSGNDLNPAKAELISGVAGKLAFDNYTVTNQAYLVIPYAIYVNKFSEFKDVAIEDLDGAKVAIYKNGSIGEKLKFEYPHIELVYVDIADEAFEYLENQDIDAYIGNELVIDYHIEFHRLGFVKKSNQTPFNSEVKMAVRNDEKILLSIINKALKYIGPNNPKILNHWKTHQTSHPLYVIAVALLLVTLSAVSYWLYTVRKKAKLESLDNQKKMWHQANYDLQTDMPNRNYYETEIQQTIQLCKDQHTFFALLFIDLDDFKSINDVSGHSTGDKLLKEVGQRLISCIRENDFAARLGGDEFVVIVRNIQDFHVVDGICQKILNFMRLPFRINQVDYYVTATIGVAKFAKDSIQAEELLRFADQAMYQAKREGRDRFVYFTHHMQESLNDKISTANDLRIALQTNQFELVYQPVLSLNTLKTIKAEALIRWHHPTKGLIHPDKFIKIAEETGMIHPLGGWIFSQVIKDMVLLRETMGDIGKSFMIGINISPLQFSQPQYLNDFLLELRNHQLSPNNVCFEITEGVLLAPSQTVIQSIKGMKAEGIKLSIDDFGTGYSALAYLKRFDVDYVKIDKSFIKDLDTNHYNKILCESIINMSHKLEIELIAEGVEYPIQAQMLKEWGCDYIQGFLHGKPMTLAELIARESPTL